MAIVAFGNRLMLRPGGSGWGLSAVAFCKPDTPAKFVDKGLEQAMLGFEPNRIRDGINVIASTGIV
jgi:hypothetical protein